MLRRRIAEGEDMIERANRGAAEAAQALSRLQEDEAKLHSEAQNRGAAQTRPHRQPGRSRARLPGPAPAAVHLRVRYRRGRARAQRRRGSRRPRAHGVVAARRRGAAAGSIAVAGQLTPRNAATAAGRRRGHGGRRPLPAGWRQRQRSRKTAGVRRRSKGLVGLVRDLIRVQPGLERAIEASLAENVQALVFENLPSALAAIDLLTERQGGRAVLYPLDPIKPQPPLNLMRETRRRRRRGQDGARATTASGTLIDVLLGRTIICRERAAGAVCAAPRPRQRRHAGRRAAAAQRLRGRRRLGWPPPRPSRDRTSSRSCRKKSPRWSRASATSDSRLERERENLQQAEAALAEAEPRCQPLREERGRSPDGPAGQPRPADPAALRGARLLRHAQRRVTTTVTRAAAGASA